MPSSPRLVLSVVFLAMLTGLGACTAIEYEDHWMDSAGTRDPTLDDPTILLSTRFLEPTVEQLGTPVVVAAHGFGGSTYEWLELAEYLEARGILVSRVLLGGHGRNLDAWLDTDENDWGRPIVDELKTLDALGYQNVSVVTSSTSGTLLAKALLEGALNEIRPPQHFMMVAPFIVSADKRLYVAPVLGPILGNLPSRSTDLEKELFYYNRPAAVFNPLMNLLNTVEAALNGPGIPVTKGTQVTVWLGDDPVVAPESVEKLQSGLKSDHPASVVEVDTRLHVHTRSLGRASSVEDSTENGRDGKPVVWEEEDTRRQEETFEEIFQLVRATRR
jgi:carboxylesterase